MRSPDTDVERIEGLLRGVPPESAREAHLDGLIRELRTAAPAAPRELRERVRVLKPAERRRQLGWKPVLVVVPVAAALLGAALLGGPQSSSDGDGGGAEATSQPGAARDTIAPLRPETSQSQDAQVAPPTLLEARAQEWDVRLELAVRDNTRLSEASAEAISTTRALGGYVVSSNVATHGAVGEARLVVRIPQRRVQDAITQLSALGTITGQDVTVQDREAELDQLAARIDTLRVRIAGLNVRLRTEQLDEAARLRLELQRAQLRRTLNEVTRRRSGVADQVAMADVSLTLQTRRAAGAATGRFDGAVDDAVAVLAVAGSVALFLAIVLTPLALLAVLGLAARRAWRRRGDERLLDRRRPTPPVSSR